MIVNNSERSVTIFSDILFNESIFGWCPFHKAPRLDSKGLTTPPEVTFHKYGYIAIGHIPSGNPMWLEKIPCLYIIVDHCPMKRKLPKPGKP